MVDCGANHGFIVSKKGFQSVCREASQNTNIKLVNLKELEIQLYDRWKKTMTERYMPYSDRLFPYWDPTGGKKPKDGQPVNWDQNQLLIEAFYPLVQHGVWTKKTYPFPIKLPVLDKNFEIVGEKIINNYRDYFDFLEENKEIAFEYFKKLFREQ